MRAYPGRVKRLLRGVACAAWVAAGACSQAPAPADPRLWTLFTDQALSAGGATAIAKNEGLPGGIPLNLIVNGSTLAQRTALADGGSVTFLTTEVWANYPQVWMQPAYVPITGWAADGTPVKLVDASGWHPIFSVGPQSGFYSPFWQIVYAQVPAGTAPGALTSARQILDGGYPLTPGEGRTMPLVPDGTSSGGTTPGTAQFNPIEGWLNGTAISFLDFGSGTFAWDAAANVVQPAPIYVFTLTGSDGTAHAFPGIPTVLGDTPPGPGNGQPLQIDGQWRFSTYWRVNTIALPPGARVFAPPNSQVGDDLGTLAGAYTTALTSADPSTYAIYEGLVALDAGDPSQGIAGCFDDPSDLPGCNWLDSEDALRQIDLSIAEPTGLTLTWEVIGVADALGAASTPVEVLP